MISPPASAIESTSTSPYAWRARPFCRSQDGMRTSETPPDLLPLIPADVMPPGEKDPRMLMCPLCQGGFTGDRLRRAEKLADQWDQVPRPHKSKPRMDQLRRLPDKVR